MVQTTKQDIDSKILYILEKMRDEYEIIKRQGFPAHKQDYYSTHSRNHDAKIPQHRYWVWKTELGIDHVQLEAILKILENEGLLEKSEFIPDYV